MPRALEWRVSFSRKVASLRFSTSLTSQQVNLFYLYLSPGSGRRLSENSAPAEVKPSIFEELLLLPAAQSPPPAVGPSPLGPPRIRPGTSKCTGCVGKVSSGALWGSYLALWRSSSACLASQKRFGSDLGSILGPSDLENHAGSQTPA